jgi:DNA-binding MarR family transcriptional regulator
MDMLISLASKSQEQLVEVEMKKQSDLTPTPWKIMLALNMIDGLTQKELVEKIFIDSNTLVPVVDKMKKNGLVERKTDSKDRRTNRIFLIKKPESIINSLTMIIIQSRKIIYNKILAKETDLIKNIIKTMIKNSNSAMTEIKSYGRDRS